LELESRGCENVTETFEGALCTLDPACGSDVMYIGACGVA
jgi:hypothetical protein